jgi:hypothetical protein
MVQKSVNHLENVHSNVLLGQEIFPYPGYRDKLGGEGVSDIGHIIRNLALDGGQVSSTLPPLPPTPLPPGK